MVRTIVGVSAGRPGKVTDSAVKALLEATGQKTRFFSLSQSSMKMCLACNGCVESNRCLLDDDVAEIIDALMKADALVFGAPRYWEGVNARARGFWERVCFSGRHREAFPLEGKPSVLVAVSGSGDASAAARDLRSFMKDARLTIVEEISLQGEFACFTCGHGPTCMVGGYVEMYGPGTPVTPEQIPCLSNQHPQEPLLKRDMTPEIRRAGERLAQDLG